MNTGVCNKLKMLGSVALAMILLAMTGCSKKDVYDPKGPVDDGPVFDFSTRESYTLNVNYDVPQGYKVYFEVYTQDPEQLDADGQVVKRDLNPVDVGFTDGDGSYSHKIVVPATAKYLYIYSPYAGVPRVLVAEISNGVLSEATYPDEVSGARSLLARAGDEDYKDAAYNGTGGLKRLGYWKNAKGEYSLNGKKFDLYGRPDYVNYEKITISKDILNLINQAVPEGGGVKPNLIKNGNIHVTKEANIDLFLIDENTSANSTLAYYCYETKNPPKSVAEIKDDVVIAFPNSKVLKYHGDYPKGNNGALERGEGIRLHYWKNGTDMGEDFPEGISIGWVIYNNGYQSGVSGKGGINTKQKHFYSDKVLNGDKKEHVALFRSGDKILFGFEDWNGDYDYNDVVFYIKSNPIDAITPDIPDVKPEEPDDSDIKAKVTYRGILTFEDIWPYRGDFDMNDVVVKYVSTVGYNQKNEVIQTEDVYTILWSGASYDNSFAYQLDVMRSEVDVTFSSSLGGNGGAFVDQTLDKATIRLANKVLEYASKEEKATFTVTTKYTGRRIAKDDFTLPPYNPFITTTDDDKEVHLTNMRPTEKLDKENLGHGHDKSDPGKNLYYITYDEEGQQMPFAINLVFEDDEAMDAFVVPFCDPLRESKRIDIFYPAFLNWVKTNGRESTDWYLHPQK